MKSNNRGFSLLELLAILFITTALIVPLLSSLVGNIEVNDRAQLRRSATSIAEGTIYGFEKIDFTELRTQLDTANSSVNHLEFRSNNCTNLPDVDDSDLCAFIFAQQWGDLDLDETTFKVYLFDYALTTAQENSLTGSGTIEPEVIAEIQSNTDIQAEIDETKIPDLIRVVVWIEYYEDPELHVILTGLIFND